MMSWNPDYKFLPIDRIRIRIQLAYRWNRTIELEFDWYPVFGLNHVKKGKKKFINLPFLSNFQIIRNDFTGRRGEGGG